MPLSKEKARKILHEGMANGKRLSARQRRFMGAVSSGAKIRKKGY